MRERVAAKLAPLLNTEPGFLLAFSGGLDSTVLLHVLASLNVRLRVRHVHHGLSIFADRWREHCRQVCEALDVPLEVLHVEVDRADSAGLEAAARHARHAALRDDWPGWILFAHHADDQAETLLFRLVRGAGVHGAACMREIDAERKLARPLLGETRACLEAYAREHELEWVEDDSNPDERFSRNFLRHQVMKPLVERFPGAAANMARSARLFEEADELLSELAAIDAERIVLGAPGSRVRLKALPEPRARNLLRFWLKPGNTFLPEFARLEEGLRQLCGEAAVRWVFGHSALCAYRDRLWLESARLPELRFCVWHGEPALPWGDGFVRFSPEVSARWGVGLRLEAARPGLRHRLGEGRPVRSLKLLCQDAGIPPWWRDRLPCLWRGEALLWVGGLGNTPGLAWEA